MQAWALHRAGHYCLGNPDLVLAVDHKPLLKILGDKHLDDIDDPRMLNLKEKKLFVTLLSWFLFWAASMPAQMPPRKAQSAKVNTWTWPP